MLIGIAKILRLITKKSDEKKMLNAFRAKPSLFGLSILMDNDGFSFVKGYSVICAFCTKNIATSKCVIAN